MTEIVVCILLTSNQMISRAILEQMRQNITLQSKEFRKSFNKLLCCKQRVVQQPTGDSPGKAKVPAVPHPEEQAGGSYTGDSHVKNSSLGICK